MDGQSCSVSGLLFHLFQKQEFEEAAGLLKDTKEKREGLFLKVKELLTAQNAEDPMGKIKQAITSMEELSKNPVADLVEVFLGARDLVICDSPVLPVQDTVAYFHRLYIFVERTRVNLAYFSRFFGRLVLSRRPTLKLQLPTKSRCVMRVLLGSRYHAFCIFLPFWIIRGSHKIVQ